MIYHLKEITFAHGGKALVYGPGHARDIQNPNKKGFTDRLQSFRRRHSTVAFLYENRKFPARSVREGQVYWGDIASVINVHTNNLPLYLSYEWKSDLFDDLLRKGSI